MLKLTSKDLKWTSCWVANYLKIQLVPFRVGSTYGKYVDAISGGSAIDTYACYINKVNSYSLVHMCQHLPIFKNIYMNCIKDLI